MEREYIASLPDGFFLTISSPIKIMSVIKKQYKSKLVRPVIDLLRLLIVGQRQIELEPLFAYELFHHLLMSMVVYEKATSLT